MRRCTPTLIVAFAITSILLATRVLAYAAQDVPTGPPDATIDLATSEGARLVEGQWRYSDTKIIEVDFRAPGPDGQPTGNALRVGDHLLERLG